MQYDVFGIGNALMDILIKVNDQELRDLDIKKGRVQLVNEEEAKEIQGKIKGKEIQMAPGGSSANTVSGVVNLGGKAAFCGKVGMDEYGIVYEQKMVKDGVSSKIVRGEGMTGKAFTFITPDSERTFATYLGASKYLMKEDISEKDIIQSRFLHLTGYVLENGLQDVSLHAMEIAKKNGVKISLDLADISLIEGNLAFFKEIVKEYANIVFVNEQEAEAFTKKKAIKALDEIANIVDIAVVKLGKKGSLIKQDAKVYEIPPVKTNPVDTTGAGDMYNAGILYGLSQGKDLCTSGRIGSFVASKIVEQLGARLDYSLKDEVSEIMKKDLGYFS
ncbi:MAG: adenosine kinase [bacterium]|nr:adenosine kinase [bacterium]